MKIICVGRNYLEHINELNNSPSSEILFFIKPETSIPIKNQPFFIPDFSNNIHHEIEIVLKINKTGKHIHKEFAEKYFDEITVGVDFTARDVQDKLKNKNEPWEKAKAFDGSAPVGTFVDKNKFVDINKINFKLLINNKIKQVGNSSNMIYDFKSIISYVSKFITLKKGDLIFTGTPPGVGQVNKNDLIEGFIEEDKVLEIKIK
tara:strand:+ start:1733 stop:2344 length:612 start_codon:yes stop_codon:yes gene_type:complete